MPDSAEQLIINRLAQAPSFHPSGAKLFVPDWTLDPGDVVTVQSDGESYDVPIYSMDLTWNGACRADIQSTGNQQREPLSALRRKEYQAGRRGYGQFKEIDDEFKEFETWQTQTDEVIGTYAAQFVDILGDGTNEGRLTLAETAIEQTASDATITAQAAGILLDEDGHPILDERGKYQYDPNAIKVLAPDGHHVGYVPGDMTDAIRASVTLPSPCFVYIGENNGHYFSDAYVTL